MLSYVTERLKVVLREEPGKEKDMFTIISKFYLNSEFKHEALHAHKQSYDAVRLDQMKHYCEHNFSFPGSSLKTAFNLSVS